MTVAFEKKLEKKIDELTNSLGREFSSIHREFTEIHNEFAEVHSELSGMKETATTKEDLVRLRGDFDIMLDHHIGTFRKDYDELAARVKNLERLVMKN